MMDTEPDIADAPDAIAVERLHGDIDYRDVTFAYDAQRPVLQQYQPDDPSRAKPWRLLGRRARAKQRCAACCRASMM